MPEVLLAVPATEEFQNLSLPNRKRVLKVLQSIQKSSAQLKPVRIHSSILGTSLFMIRSAKLRLLYEMDEGRAVVLSIHGINPSSRRIK